MLGSEGMQLFMFREWRGRDITFFSDPNDYADVWYQVSLFSEEHLLTLMNALHFFFLAPYRQSALRTENAEVYAQDTTST